MYLLNLISIFTFLVICTYFDLKERIIPNKLLKIYLIVTVILIAFEFFYYLDLILWYITIKLVVFLSVFILSLTLFSLKFIGGGDGKVLLLLFHSLPFLYIFHFLQYFFLIFSFSLIVTATLIIITSKKEKRYEEGDSLIKTLKFIHLWVSKSSIDLKSKDLGSFRRKVIFPMLVPILFSYIIMVICVLFIL
ncbi:hypothetical protein LCGC14_0667970 [marine sediment metagenome]|uniref:Prepilin type IV endopeptidase peptidase domain-containing protein n=1 Tax=marine sediment metagenome TaxID=412755 RepID=A0A0F9TD74_9ZZZZ